MEQPATCNEQSKQRISLRADDTARITVDFLSLRWLNLWLIADLTTGATISLLLQSDTSDSPTVNI